MNAFTYQSLPTRVIFGTGTLDRLKDEAERLGITRALVLSTPGQVGLAEEATRRLGDLSVGIFAQARMHTPVAVTGEAMLTVVRERPDGLVAIGGGSTTGLGKAIAYRTGLPLLAIPTTYAGSEMTPTLGQTEHGRKTALRSHAVLPKTVIYDVALSQGLPVGVAVTSGFNAIAHAVEALYAQDRNPVTSLMAEEGITALGRALPRIVEDPQGGGARSDALYGAWLCGICLGSVGMSLHHKLCHTLGGLFDLPHAPLHTVLLPHSLRYNFLSATDAAGRVARALGAQDAPRALQDLSIRLGAPASLQAIGMPADGIEPAAAAALANPYWNPAPISEDLIRDMLGRAYRGDPA